MRGEYRDRTGLIGFPGGSSPHAWGILLQAWADYLDQRFIPTCVGNTEIVAAGLILKTVHPHMRGEYLVGEGLDSADGGSSPHAWGIRAVGLGTDGIGRFIPTCVGNTKCLLRLLGLPAVHPHMRGEYYSWYK